MPKSKFSLEEASKRIEELVYRPINVVWEPVASMASIDDGIHDHDITNLPVDEVQQNAEGNVSFAAPIPSSDSPKTG